MFVPLLIVIVGFVFLLKNLGFISGSVWSVLWPLLLIAFGLYMIVKHYRYQMFWDRLWRKLE